MKYEKFEKYEKPELEELEIMLEGSFLLDSTGKDKDDESDPIEGDAD